MRRFVMTDGFMTGKTTWIGRMLRMAGIPVQSSNPALAQTPCRASSGLRIAGVYTPAVFESGKKVAIDAVLLPGLERFRFAEAQPWFDGVEGGGEHEAGNPKGAWNFSDVALERVNKHLATCTDCDLLLIDELGPLELVRSEGFTEGMRLLDEGELPVSLVVVRPALLDRARERWGSFEKLNAGSNIEEFLAAVGEAADK